MSHLATRSLSNQALYAKQCPTYEAISASFTVSTMHSVTCNVMPDKKIGQTCKTENPTVIRKYYQTLKSSDSAGLLLGPFHTYGSFGSNNLISLWTFPLAWFHFTQIKCQANQNLSTKGLFIVQNHLFFLQSE